MAQINTTFGGSNSSASVGVGTVTGQTLRWNGTQWVANSVIFNNGTDVGIGTATLGGASKLTIQASSTSLIRGNNSSGTQVLWIDNAGKIGVGGTPNVQFYANQVGGGSGLALLRSGNGVIISGNSGGGGGGMDELRFVTGNNSTSFGRIYCGGAIAQTFTPLVDGLNIGFFAESFGSGAKVFCIGNATTNPTVTPTNAFVLYSDTSRAKIREEANRFVVQAVASTKTVAGAPYTNDGYVEIVINGTTVKVMTTA